MERFSFFPFYVGTTIIVAKQQKKKKKQTINQFDMAERGL
jgi:hypothetical protein